MTHPSAPREPLVEDLAGHRVADPYRWLEDESDPRTREFLAEQDDCFRRARERWADHDGWRQAVADCTRSAAAALPLVRGARRFQLARRPDGPGQRTDGAPVLRVVATDGRERDQTSLDLAPLCADGGAVRGFRPSWEGDRLVCMVSVAGGDTVRLHVLDTRDGAPVEPPLGPLPAAWVAWLPGGAAFYYVGPADPGGPAYERRVRLHRIGTDPATDPVVFGAGLPSGSHYGLTVDPAGGWLAVTVSAGAASHHSLWTARLHRDERAPEWRRVTGDAFRAAVAPRFGPDGRLYLLTDADAPRGRVCVADPERPEPEHWREVVAEDPDAVLEDCILLRGTDGPVALALRTRHGCSELTAHGPRPDATPHPVPLPGAGIVSGLRARPDGGGEAWLLYSDFVTPGAVYRYDTGPGTLEPCPLLPDQPRDRAPADPARGRPYARPYSRPYAGSAPRVRSRLVSYPAPDGTTVRMFLLSPDLPPDDERPGPCPTIVSGYGGFGVPLRPVYSPVVLAWVAAGGHYALACVRGGGEEGSAWHEGGRGRHKTVAVGDFVAAADWLVGTGATEPGMLAAAGASHGGFLVAAAAMRRPDLYAAVLCADPLLDLVRCERLGVGATWTEEFGSADDPRQLADLLTISPYHQVRTGTAYPAVLFSGGTEDPRLDAAHVRKMCAALQHASTRPEHIVMRRGPGVGPGTRTAPSTLELNADTLAFLATHTGLRLPSPRGSGPPVSG